MAWNIDFHEFTSGELTTALTLRREITERWQVAKTHFTDTGHLRFPAATTLQIADGEISVTGNVHSVQPNDSGDDVIETITRGDDQLNFIILRGGLDGSGDPLPVTIDSNGFDMSGDFELEGPWSQIAFYWDADEETWIELFRNTGGGGSAKPFLTLVPQAFVPTSSNGAIFDIRNGHPILSFQGSSADTEAVVSGVLPPGYQGGGLLVTIYVSFASATSGTATFQAAFERVQPATLDIDADSFASFKSGSLAAASPSGNVSAITISFDDGSEAGDPFRLKIRRDQDGTSGTDDITTAAQVWAVTIEEAA